MRIVLRFFADQIWICFTFSSRWNLSGIDRPLKNRQEQTINKVQLDT